MFATGLSEPLINALVDLAVHIRALLPPIQGAQAAAPPTADAVCASLMVIYNVGAFNPCFLSR